MFRVFRFTIREIILITIIVALALGWWVDRRELTRLRRIEIQEYTAIRNMAARMTSAIKTKLHLEIDTKPTGRLEADGTPEYEIVFTPRGGD